MNLTEAEKAKLEENRGKIIHWINDNILPKLQADDTIRAGFGGMKQSMDCNTTTPAYQIGVSGSEKEFCDYYSNARGSKGHIAFGRGFLGLVDNFEKGVSSECMMIVLENWGKIKSQLVQEVNSLNQKRNLIANFEP